MHTVVQLPQCCTSLVRVVSQPLAAMPSQLPNPDKQVIEHWPMLHDAVPPLVEHALAHMPQLAGSVLRLISHPFEALLSQSPRPGLHAMEQAPLLQFGVPVLAATAAATLRRSSRGLLATARIPGATDCSATAKRPLSAPPPRRSGLPRALWQSPWT